MEPCEQNFHENVIIFIQENAFKNDVNEMSTTLYRIQCVKGLVKIQERNTTSRCSMYLFIAQ